MIVGVCGEVCVSERERERERESESERVCRAYQSRLVKWEEEKEDEEEEELVVVAVERAALFRAANCL